MRSSRLRVSKRRRTFSRFLGKVQHALNQALVEEHEKRGLTRAEIARILETDKGFVTKKLAGTSNMTIETLADLAFAMDRDITIALPPRTVAIGSNFKPANAESGTSPPQNIGGAQILAVAV